ncbi:conserved hypothetical protein [Neospora caninum Liverpool]|uniref:Uncharacterized protein n=1 Tax=Neospora caninum (strain Liverpool) TaxID=572307 RepID=F0VJT9_NEOCL|nr:conserved hypothetical protein [Neospora caninum Liverpool]CBZ54000.1 conserved hypothetical protein [Neospora caninum Liverpool]CEL68002.1 TPA: hypothetical protein BN1204_037820 [Neospora caninum Liverpool]|eukprot:XP_003884032.1 conserved hypothetical protein [Neospora caninum Liverpool]
MLAFVAVYVHHTEVLALVDTGSEATLISPFIVNLLNLPVNREYRGLATHHTSSVSPAAAPGASSDSSSISDSSCESSNFLPTSTPSRAHAPPSRAPADRPASHLPSNESEERSEPASNTAVLLYREKKGTEGCSNPTVETGPGERMIEQAEAVSEPPRSPVSVHGVGSKILGRVENLQVTLPVFSLERETVEKSASEATTERLTRDKGEKPGHAAGRSAVETQRKSRGGEAHDQASTRKGERLASRTACLLPILCDAIVLEDAPQASPSSPPRASLSFSTSSSISVSSQFSFVLGLDALVALDAVVDFPRRRLLLGNGRFAAELFLGPPSALGTYMRETTAPARAGAQSRVCPCDESHTTRQNAKEERPRST